MDDVNLKIVEVLTVDYEFEQRTILYKDNITRAEIEAIVRQRYTLMSRSSTKSRKLRLLVLDLDISVYLCLTIASISAWVSFYDSWY